MKTQLFPLIIAQNCLSYHCKRQVWLFFTKNLRAHLSSHRIPSFPKLSYGKNPALFIQSYFFSHEQHLTIALNCKTFTIIMPNLRFFLKKSSSKVNLSLASMVARTGKLLNLNKIYFYKEKCGALKTFKIGI